MKFNLNPERKSKAELAAIFAVCIVAVAFLAWTLTRNTIGHWYMPVIVMDFLLTMAVITYFRKQRAR